MHNLPEKHQTLLFSATMPVEIEALAQVYLISDSFAVFISIYILLIKIRMHVLI